MASTPADVNITPARSSRSAAAASRRNGALSKGPKTAAGKRKSSRNALRHGLRASDAVEPNDVPTWIRRRISHLIEAAGQINQLRREHLDRLIIDMMLIERTDELIAAELGRLFSADEDDQVMLRMPAQEIDLAMLATLTAYRRRFRARRDRSLIKLATSRAPGSRPSPTMAPAPAAS